MKKRGGVANLSDEYLDPKENWEYKGVLPYPGRYWAYSYENMRLLALAGRLRHTSTECQSKKDTLMQCLGFPSRLWTDIRPLLAHERLGYPTEKPPALLERIVATSSNPGDVVLDPFCGWARPCMRRTS
jgi:DNA modification methylase